MMTHDEWLAKKQIMEQLAEEGHGPYAKLLDKFDVNLTQDPNCVAYMEPNKARIVINSGLNIDQVSTIVRHEILHEFFTHQNRLLNHLGIDQSKLSIDMHELGNIAGDYDISNKGYTDADKRVARKIMLNGQKLKGLVTEDDHPDWVDLSFEEMFDKLKEEREKEFQDAMDQISDDYAAGWNQAIADYKAGKLKF